MREGLGKDRRQARGVRLGVALPTAGRVDLREVAVAGGAWDWPEDVVAGRRRSARRSVGRRGAAELEIGDGEGGVV